MGLTCLEIGRLLSALYLPVFVNLSPNVEEGNVDIRLIDHIVWTDSGGRIWVELAEVRRIMFLFCR